MFIFGASVNCVPWVYVPEILPLHGRAQGTAIGTSSNWLWNFTVVMITPVIINRLQWKAYLISRQQTYVYHAHKYNTIITNVCIVCLCLYPTLLLLLPQNE